MPLDEFVTHSLHFLYLNKFTGDLKRKIISLLVTCLFISNIMNSQEYYFKHYQVEEGLSNNTVLCATQDKNGFLWFGTKDGLNRFDGYAFKVFKNIKNNPCSIGNDVIWRLYEDKTGILWAGTEKGLYYYNDTTECFNYLKNSPADLIRGIVRSSDNRLYFITGFSLYSYYFPTGELKEHRFSSPQQITSLALSSNEKIFLGTLNGTLIEYDPVKKTESYFSLFDHSVQAVSNSIEKIYDDGNGNLYIGTSSQGLKLFNLNKNYYEDIFSYEKDKTGIFVRDIIKYNNEIWIAAETGIYIYDSISKKLINFKKNYSNPYSLSDNAVYSLCADKSGGIWATTYFGGINYYSNNNLSFQKYFPGVTENSLKGNAIREIQKDNNGNLWIGTEDAGLNKYDARTGNFKNFLPDGTPQSIAYTNIHGLLVDKNTLWIGTFEHGLDKMDLNTEKVVRHYTAGTGEDDLKSNFIHSLYKTREGKIAIATSNGFYFYNRQKDNFHLVRSLPFNTFYSTVTEDAAGNIWIGTFNAGLYFINLSKKITARIQIKKEKEDVFSKTRITKIHVDKKQNLWISTERGLYYYDPATKKVKEFNERTGLPSSMVYNTLQDEQENLWITTSKGLVRMSPDGERINLFTKSNGLLNDQFNYASGYYDEEGKMYFGSVKGMISFIPANYILNNNISPVFITGFQISNKEIAIGQKNSPLKKSLLLTDKIVLKHNQSTFSLDFATLDYISPATIEYAYKMEGLDNEWNYIKENRRVYFTNLSAGSYKFRVKSTNSTGVWVPNEKILSIIILPPWWKTQIAYFIYFILLASVFYLILRYYHIRQLEKQQKKMILFQMAKGKEFHEAKINFFTKVAHEIRTPLTLIKAPVEKILAHKNSVPHLEKYLLSIDKNTDRLLSLTNQLLDFRKVESENYPLELVETNITELVKNIYSSFCTTAEQKNISFELLLQDAPLIAKIDKEAFTKIISNLLDNAIKYCKNSVVTTIAPVHKNENVLKVKVSSDGKKIAAELHDKIFDPFFRITETGKTRGTGIGLPLARSLAELHGGQLTIVSDENNNTFVLTIPLDKL